MFYLKYGTGKNSLITNETSPLIHSHKNRTIQSSVKPTGVEKQKKPTLAIFVNGVKVVKTPNLYTC